METDGRRAVVRFGRGASESRRDGTVIAPRRRRRAAFRARLADDVVREAETALLFEQEPALDAAHERLVRGLSIRAKDRGQAVGRGTGWEQTQHFERGAIGVTRGGDVLGQDRVGHARQQGALGLWRDVPAEHIAT